MKKVLSLSMGSPKRNHTAEVELFGESFTVERIGTDGDNKKLKYLFEKYDGSVDAFGLGGFDLWVNYGEKRYKFREAAKAIKNVKKTPVADGASVKKTLEVMAVKYLVSNKIIDPNQVVMIPSACSRYHMYKAFKEEGFKVRWGDIAFGLGIGSDAMDSEKFMDFIAYTTWPLLVKVPFKWLYPVSNQDVIVPKYKKAYDSADIIAGDFHFIYKHLPERIDGKIIITNTLTNDEIDVLKQKGAKLVISVTPEFNGRSFGTNVVEACVCAHFNRKPEEISLQEFTDLFKKYDIKPRIIDLSQKGD
ncbi:MAG: quinate 5-dehydrogenase [Caldisericia bacterium]|nr:quinate 5-dehydrogenase [Caldisericia bacterium]